MCNLCHGTHIIHTAVMPGVVVAEPCPNCNEALKEKRHEEFKQLLLNGGQTIGNSGTR